MWYLSTSEGMFYEILISAFHSPIQLPSLTKHSQMKEKYISMKKFFSVCFPKSLSVHHHFVLFLIFSCEICFLLIINNINKLLWKVIFCHLQKVILVSMNENEKLFFSWCAHCLWFLWNLIYWAFAKLSISEVKSIHMSKNKKKMYSTLESSSHVHPCNPLPWHSHDEQKSFGSLVLRINKIWSWVSWVKWIIFHFSFFFYSIWMRSEGRMEMDMIVTVQKSQFMSWVREMDEILNGAGAVVEALLHLPKFIFFCPSLHCYFDKSWNKYTRLIDFHLIPLLQNSNCVQEIYHLVFPPSSVFL